MYSDEITAAAGSVSQVREITSQVMRVCKSRGITTIIIGHVTKEGNIAEEMMYNTFNMGLGMIVAVDPADVDKTMEAIKAAGDTPYVVGSVEAGEKGVTLC